MKRTAWSVVSVAAAVAVLAGSGAAAAQQAGAAYAVAAHAAAAREAAAPAGVLHLADLRTRLMSTTRVLGPKRTPPCSVGS